MRTNNTNHLLLHTTIFLSQTSIISAADFCTSFFAFGLDGGSLNHRVLISKQSADFINGLSKGVNHAARCLNGTNGSPIGANGSVIRVLDAAIGVSDSVIGALGAVIGVPDSAIGAPDSAIGAIDTANSGLKSIKCSIFLLKSINSIHNY
ncbi:MAG: hypothetical protein IPP77_02310 [Bacteroidetes bacterium]|nr:hypothetical protein [Bacteroidota bacterium]